MIKVIEKETKGETGEKKFIPLYYDKLFKKVFCDDNDLSLLKYLLNQALDINPVDIVIKNAEILGDVYQTKRTYLDLVVKLDNGTVVNIEVNTNSGECFKDRNFAYECRLVSNNLKPNDQYVDLSKHIQLNLNINSPQTKPIMNYQLIDLETKEVLTDKLQIIHIDVSYYVKKCYNEDIEKLSEFEKLMGLIGSKEEEKLKFFKDEKGTLMDIMEKADKFRNDDNIIEAYDYDEMMESLKRREIRDAEKKATIDTTNEIAVNLINLNVDVENISKATGLTIEQINALKNNME